MSRLWVIVLTLAVATPPLLFAGAVLGWLSRDREDNAELAEMRATCAEAAATCLKADALLANVQADLAPKTVPQQRRVRVTCGVCGVVEVQSDLVAQPVTRAEWDEALSVILTEHAIAAHLDEVA